MTQEHNPADDLRGAVSRIQPLINITERIKAGELREAADEPTGQTLYHTFSDGVKMYKGGSLEATQTQFVKADGSYPTFGAIMDNYLMYEQELKNAGKDMGELVHSNDHDLHLRDAMDIIRPLVNDTDGRIDAETHPTPKDDLGPLNPPDEQGWQTFADISSNDDTNNDKNSNDDVKVDVATSMGSILGKAVEEVSDTLLAVPNLNRFVGMAKWEPKMQSSWSKDHLVVVPFITLIDEHGCVFTFVTKDGRLAITAGLSVKINILPEEGETLQSLIIRKTIEQLDEHLGLAFDPAALEEAFKQSFLIYMPIDFPSSRKLGLSATLNVTREQLTRVKLDAARWMDREYVNLHLTLATMMKPEALQWTFDVWSHVYLSTTSHPDALKNYRSGLAKSSQLYTRLKHVIDRLNWAAKDMEGWTPLANFSLEIDTQGFVLLAKMPGAEKPTQFVLPTDDLFDKAYLSLDSSNQDEPKPVYYVLESTITGVKVRTSDFVTWTTVADEAAAQ